MDVLDRNGSTLTKQRVLVIDDDPVAHRLVGHLLGSLGVETLNAYSGHDGLDVAQDSHPSLIVLDYSMPGCNGLEFLDLLKCDPELSSIPVLMITASEDPRLVTLAFEKGVTDYVTKPIHAAAFKARVKSILQRQSLLQDLKTKYEFDDLTGLLSKQSMVDQIALTIENGKTNDTSYAVIMVDLDRFKLINDSLGHSLGDEVIKEVSTRLSGKIRKSDKISRANPEKQIARLSGDKFVILIKSIDSLNDLKSIANRILSQLQKPFSIAGGTLHINASLGVVACCGQYCDAGDILRDADIAMYAAKDAGRGCFKFFDVGMREIVQKRWRLDHDLRVGIAQRQFELLYQPIINLQTDEVESVEALIRWNHPQRGLVTPSEFIPLAEETGLILDIGRWVAREACRQYAEWLEYDPALTPEHISINLARQELLQPKFCEDISAMLTETRVDPQRVHFEVTENQIMDNLPAALKTLYGLKSLGAKIDLDDFGTGHSSLACLHDLPIDVIKLDRSLIETIDMSGDFLDLASLVVKLLAGTDISVVAEGIETETQLSALKQIGCQLGQGYLFSRPMKAKEVPAFVKAQRAKQSGQANKRPKDPIICIKNLLQV